MPLKLVFYSLLFGEEYLISHKLNVYMIADHLAFRGQLCSPEDAGVSIAHKHQIINLFSSYHFPSMGSRMHLTQVSGPSGERV